MECGREVDGGIAAVKEDSANRLPGHSNLSVTDISSDAQILGLELSRITFVFLFLNTFMCTRSQGDFWCEDDVLDNILCHLVPMYSTGPGQWNDLQHLF